MLRSPALVMLSLTTISSRVGIGTPINLVFMGDNLAGDWSLGGQEQASLACSSFLVPCPL